MTRKTSTILVVGAAGKFAGLVVPALSKRGAHIRALIHDSTHSDVVLKRGAAEVIVGDLRDPANMDAALNGVESVFYIAPTSLPDEAEVGKSIVKAAKQAGVRRFVFSALIHPILSALPHHLAKVPVEDAIIASDMEFTLLHPTMFFQNIASSWPTVIKTGVFAEPWSTDTRFTRVDYRDVAEVAAIALTEDRLLYGTYELCAEGNLNRKDVAMLMGEVLGREIKATKLSLDKPATATGSPGDAQMTALKPMFDWYDVHGLLGNALILRAILGHEPRTLRAYFEELAATAMDAT